MIINHSIFVDPFRSSLCALMSAGEDSHWSHIALWCYPHVKWEIENLSQITTTVPIFLQFNYFRQKYLEIASCAVSLLNNISLLQQLDFQSNLEQQFNKQRENVHGKTIANVHGKCTGSNKEETRGRTEHSPYLRSVPASTGRHFYFSRISLWDNYYLS